MKMAEVQCYSVFDSLKSRRDTMITYNIVYNCAVGTVQQRTFSCVQEYAAKDFLTFIFCSRNHEASRRINSQLRSKRLSVELRDSNVLVTVMSPVVRNEDLDFKQLVFEIQQCILNMQEHLEFKETAVDESVLNNLLKSSAKQNNLLQMQVFETRDKNSLTGKFCLWLVYDIAYKDEIALCFCDVQVEEFICDFIEKHSGDSDVEMKDDDRITAVGGEKLTETIQLTTMEDVKYIDRFYKKSSDVFVKHYETGFLLTGQAFEVQNATKDIRDMVKNVSKETCEFEDNDYFSGESGFNFLKDEVEEYCQILCELKTEVTRPHGRNTVGKRKQTHSEWERDSELKLIKRRIKEGFEVLILTNIDD